jgi:PTH1 family peptidyl-tRNA hydrolase
MPATPTSGSSCRLVVGLGNPGWAYRRTPHNLGFMVLDRVAERERIRIGRKESMALVGRGRIGGTPVVLAKPQTYMNLSGHAVAELMHKNSLASADLIVVYDDLDLPWQAVRVRPKGSAGGHRGVESVISELGTADFARVRLGIAGYRVGEAAEFVLAPFRRAQRKELDELLDYAAQAVRSIISEGVEKAMTKFNRRAQGQQSEEE